MRSQLISGRSNLAAKRIPEALRSYENCHLCEHHCGVDRISGERGKCRASAAPRIFSAQVEVSDELDLIPTYAIAFSGCDLRCDFCITGAESWNPATGEPFRPDQVATRASEAIRDGARSVMFLGGEPTIHIAAALEIIAELPDEIPVIWKTNGHGSEQARRLLDELVDLWLVDYKFGNDSCAQRLSRTDNYTAILQENLCWAQTHSKLMIRHLLMPGHLECCWLPIAKWLSSNLSNAEVSLRTGFWPAWKSGRHAEFSRFIQPDEEQQAFRIAETHGLCLVS